jgi:hypothetical protein
MKNKTFDDYVLEFTGGVGFYSKYLNHNFHKISPKSLLGLYKYICHGENIKFQMAITDLYLHYRYIHGRNDKYTKLFPSFGKCLMPMNNIVPELFGEELLKNINFRIK